MKTNQPEYYEILKKLELKDPPIGVKFDFFRPEGMEQLDSGVNVSLCEIFRKSQREDKAFYFSSENDESCVGKVVLGMKDFHKYSESGELGAKFKVFEEARANRNVYQYIHKLDRDTVNYVSFSPVSKISFSPDVLVISATPDQAETVMRASIHTTGEMFTSNFTPVIGCSWIFIYPFKTGKVNFILPAFVHGLSGHALYPSDTILISIPYQRIPMVIENLNTMPLKLRSHMGREEYFKEFNEVLGDLSKRAENP